MLTRQNRRKIVEALVSGKYKQARSTLVDKGYEDPNAQGVYTIVGHCCIAVAYDVVVDTSVSRVWDMDTAAAADAVGFTGSQRELLINLNDRDHRDFSFIAGVISMFPVEDELETFDSHHTNSGEIIDLVKDEGRYRVTCWEGSDAKWSKQFGTYDEARKEFESCGTT